jgi:hypothetical protein
VHHQINKYKGMAYQSVEQEWLGLPAVALSRHVYAAAELDPAYSGGGGENMGNNGDEDA